MSDTYNRPVTLLRPQAKAVAGEFDTVNYTELSVPAKRVDSSGRENLLDDVAAGIWTTTFSVRWPSIGPHRITESWYIRDENDVVFDIISVAQSKTNKQTVDLRCERNQQ